MKNKPAVTYKIIDFKTISPFFEQERDGIKPFTVRKFEGADPRFRSLSHMCQSKKTYVIRITNPATGERFYRWYLDRRFLRYGFLEDIKWRGPEWIVIYMGKLVPFEKLEANW